MKVRTAILAFIVCGWSVASSPARAVPYRAPIKVSVILAAGPSMPPGQFGNGVNDAVAGWRAFADFVAADSYGFETWDLTFYYNHSANTFYSLPGCGYTTTERDQAAALAAADGFVASDYPIKYWTMPCGQDLEAVEGGGWRRIDKMSHLGFNREKANGSGVAGTWRCTLNGQPATLGGTCGGGPNNPWTTWLLPMADTSWFWKERFGWILPAQIAHTTSSGQWSLCAFENPSTSCLKVLKIDGQASLALVYRQASQFEQDARMNGVHLTLQSSELLNGTPAVADFTKAPLLAGQSVTDPVHGITFSVMSTSSSVATVVVSYGATPTPTVTPTPTPTTTPQPNPPCGWYATFMVNGHTYEKNASGIFRDTVNTGVYGERIGFGNDGGYDGGIWLETGPDTYRKSYGPEGWPVANPPSCLVSTNPPAQIPCPVPSPWPTVYPLQKVTFDATCRAVVGG